MARRAKSGAAAALIAAGGLALTMAAGRHFYKTHPQELWFNFYLLPPVPALRVASLGNDASLGDLLYTSTTMMSDYYRDLDERIRIDTVANATAYRLDSDFAQAIYYGHYFAEFSAIRAGKLTPENDARRRAGGEIAFLLMLGFHEHDTNSQFANVGAQERIALKDYAAAEHYARLALARDPESLLARNLVAVINLKEGDDAGALKIWRSIEVSTRDHDDPQAKYFHAVAYEKLLAIIEKPQLEKLTELTAEYRKRSGKYPYSWNDLIRTGLLAAEPKDSLGRGYILENGSGRVLLQPPPTAKEALK